MEKAMVVFWAWKQGQFPPLSCHDNWSWQLNDQLSDVHNDVKDKAKQVTTKKYSTSVLLKLTSPKPKLDFCNRTVFIAITYSCEESVYPKNRLSFYSTLGLRKAFHCGWKALASEFTFSFFRTIFPQENG